jgi:hypothetical protein
VQVTVIGKIVNVRDANMTLTLTITDGTGTVDVDHFLNDSDGGQVVRGALRLLHSRCRNTVAGFSYT